MKTLSKNNRTKFLERLHQSDAAAVLKFIEQYDSNFYFETNKPPYGYFNDIASYGSGELMQKCLIAKKSIQVDINWLVNAIAYKNYATFRVLLSHPNHKDFTSTEVLGLCGMIIEEQRKNPSIETDGIYHLILDKFNLTITGSNHNPLIASFLEVLYKKGSLQMLVNYFEENPGLTTEERLHILGKTMRESHHKTYGNYNLIVNYPEKLRYLINNTTVSENYFNNIDFPQENQELGKKFFSIKKEKQVLNMSVEAFEEYRKNKL